jgi:hypothetical protein
VPAPVVVFLAGLGRSGSTLLEMMLAERLGAVAVGETRYLWERGIARGELCSCEVSVPECPFWTSVLAHPALASLGLHPDTLAAGQRVLNRNRKLAAMLVPSLRGRRLRAALAEFARVGPPLYRAISEVSGRDVVIDSSKHPNYAAALADAGAPRLVVVHLVRDSRAVAHSWQRRVLRPEVPWNEEYMDRLGPIQAALSWNLQNAALSLARRRYRAFARVRYEDFVCRPDAALDRIAAMCSEAEASTAPGPLVHSVAGNPMRFGDRVLEIRPDVAWQVEMPAAQRRIVTALTAPGLRWYGYPLRGRRARTSSP